MARRPCYCRIAGGRLIPAVLWLREPSRMAASISNASPRALASIPAFWWIALSGAILNFALYSLAVFFPSFLTRYHHLSVAQAGVWAGIGLGISGIAGALCAGVIGDRASGNLGRVRMRIAAAAAFAAAPLAYAGIAMPAGTAALAIALIVAANAFFQMYYGLVYAAMHDIVPPHLRGAAMGAYFAVQYLGGAAWGPLLTGRLSDHFAHAASASGIAAEAARAVGLSSGDVRDSGSRANVRRRVVGGGGRGSPGSPNRHSIVTTP